MLTQIASINSVFASASLPVSVNTQGTFLNQVFMGVFRPDADGNQRWAGNLKQYKFALSGGTLFLADANGASAVDSVSTGFIQNCATSYWTADSGNFWQSIAGSPGSACNTGSGSPYSDAPDGPLVERGGAAQRLRNLGHAARNIRTCSDASCKTDGSWRLVDFNTTNVPEVPGLGAADSARLVDWARGVNNGDGTTSASGVLSFTDYGLGATATRPTVHGEVVHSRPLAINYGVSATGDDVVVFYGAGDGMLRAVNGNQVGSGAGDELWAFIAPEHWSKLNRVRIDSPRISYPDIADRAHPDTAAQELFLRRRHRRLPGAQQQRGDADLDLPRDAPRRHRGLRVRRQQQARPGRAAAPDVEVQRRRQPAMGQSWSTPLAIRVKGRTSPLVVFGAGYDACEDSDDPNTACAAVSAGRGIVVMNAASGLAASGDYRFIDPGVGAGSLRRRHGAGRRRRRRLRRRHLRRRHPRQRLADQHQRPGHRLHRLRPCRRLAGAEDRVRRPVGRRPLGATQVLVCAERGRARDADDRAGRQRRPREAVVGQPGGAGREPLLRHPRRGHGDLRRLPAIGYGISPPDFVDVTGATGIDPLALASYRGWFINLSTTSPPYEQVVTTPLTIAGVTYFSTYQAKAPGASRACTNLGTARAYQVDFQTGTGLPGQPVMQPFLSQGIPPSPVGGVVRINGVLTPFLIGGTAPTVLSPTKIVPKVKPNRKPIYRYERVDG